MQTMKHAPARPRPVPPPKADSWQSLALTIIEQAIAHYWRAKQQCDEACARYDAAEVTGGYDAAAPWEVWTDGARTALHAATVGVIRAVVAWHGVGGYDLVHVERRLFAPCAILYQGTYYLATPDPDADPPAEPGNPDNMDLMHLLILPASAIADLDTIGGAA